MDAPPPNADPLPPRPAETAPSPTLADTATAARFVGFAGLFFLVLGLVTVISTLALGPRWLSEGWGYIFSAAGLALMLYHAVRDGEQEVRRMYGAGGAILLVLAVVAALAPGPVFEAAKTDAGKVVGFNLVPWGVGFAFLGLLFLLPFARHETDPFYRGLAERVMSGGGVALLVGTAIAGFVRPDWMAGPGLALALLGLAYLLGYLSRVNTEDGVGFRVAAGLGALGAALVVFAIGRSAVPSMLFEGPAVLRDAKGELDTWKVVGRGLITLAGLGLVALGALGKFPTWVRGSFAAVGIATVAVTLVASFASNTLLHPPAPFLIPAGVILTVLGLLYLAISLGICSDNQFVTLTRRELAAYFLSPIGFLVLGGMGVIEWNQYRSFISNQLVPAGTAQEAIPEPIVSGYFVDFIPVIAILLLVPALTMRLVAEERRTGSLEVLLTAPVNETPVVLSKFLATWIFYMILWIPAGLYLIALRLETGQAFDYRPLLSFYACLGAQGIAFIGMGLFFSTLTRDQIVAAVLTFVGMIGYLLLYWLRREQTPLGIPTFLQTALGQLSFIHMWIESLSGRLPLRDVLLFLSVGVFWVFLSVKVLEARKWN